MLTSSTSSEDTITDVSPSLITPGAPTPDVVKKLTDVHPYKGDTPVKT
jgi:hypothetical protein